MEDRYLFKAKRVDNGEWVIGNLVCSVYTRNDVCVGQYGSTIGMHTVELSTVCLCTGLQKDGRLIWENDIIKNLFSDECAQIKYGSYQSCFDSTKTEHVGFYVDWTGRYAKRYRKDLGYWINMVDAEIIGNVFDNPELLKRGTYEQKTT